MTEIVTLKQVSNGWMLIWDDPEFEDGPYIKVKEGRKTALDHGLIDEFISTFLLSSFDNDENPLDDQEYQIKIDVACIKPKK